MVPVSSHLAGEGEKIWAATEKRELTHETSFHPLFISGLSVVSHFPKTCFFLPQIWNGFVEETQCVVKALAGATALNGFVQPPRSSCLSPAWALRLLLVCVRAFSEE